MEVKILLAKVFPDKIQSDLSQESLRDLENELIERYFEGNLQEENAEQFKSIYSSNEEFAQRVKEQRLLSIAFDNPELPELKESFAKINYQESKTVPISRNEKPTPAIKEKRSLVRSLMLAASVLVFFIAFGLLTGKLGSSYSNAIVQSSQEQVDKLAFSVSKSDLRIETSGFAGKTNEQVVSAVDFVNDGKFKEASKQLEFLTKQFPGNTSLAYYSGLAHLKAGRSNLAIEQFLEAKKDLRTKSDVNWFLALAYLNENEMDKAKPILNSFIQEKSKYQKAASELINLIN